ncbi:MAG TPA: hypothetical protein PK037_14955, partial [Saprospiraceae bacterium]|nr:hypothetical protein [Saprospiraceae bacterium]
MKVLVIGGNFAGATAAMEIKRKLKNKVDVTLIDRSPDFLYIPSKWDVDNITDVSKLFTPKRFAQDNN